uniref:Uncharacterized protein n=1 Tax=Triticum urartu TaxID=4572 RepID=A0A8R7JXW5_TRIUA
IGTSSAPPPPTTLSHAASPSRRRTPPRCRTAGTHPIVAKGWLWSTSQHRRGRDQKQNAKAGASHDTMRRSCPSQSPRSSMACLREPMLEDDRYHDAESSRRDP